MEDGGVFDGKEEKMKMKKKKRRDEFVENYYGINNEKSTDLEGEIEIGHKESPSSYLGETCKIAKNEEEEKIKMESSNGELKKKKKNKKKKENDCKETSSPDQETFNTANKELLDDATEMESGSGERKKTKKVIEGVEVDGKTKITGDKESIDNKKKRKNAEGSVNGTGGTESGRSVNLDEKRKSKKNKKKKRDIEEVEASKKTESARDTESIGNEGLGNSGNRKKKTEGSVNDTSGSESNESVNLEKSQTEMSNGEKEERNKKKDTDEVEVNEKTEGKDLTDSKKKRKRTMCTLNNSGESENKKRKKGNKGNEGDEDKSPKKASNSEKKKSAVKCKTKEKEKSRRVRFSGDVKVFPPSDESDVEVYHDGNLVIGKRFSPAEDKLIRKAVQNYIDINQLGEEGLEMVLNSKKYPQVRGCWKEICASIPWRPYLAVYGRARTILQMSGKRGFSEEERDIIRKFRAKHGPKWAKLAKILGKPRMHIKDAWRRFRLPNVKLGKWSQDEYQALFDLVNLDLRIKSFEERKNLNVMFRENIAWEAISEKISTRSMSSCCHKWYDQLTSPLVRQGEWVDTDDYRLIDALQKQDACDVEDVDWDHILENRSGEICRKRWDEMVRYIGGNRERSFIEQVDVLSKRYCMDMLPYRKSKEETVEEKEDD